MQAASVLSRNFESIFKSNVRFEIPFFQRGYSWNKDQWKKLFEDIHANIIDTVTDEKYEDEEYFFGPVVVLEKTGDHPELKKYLIVDGQQRITTVYILLSVIRNILRSKTHLAPSAQEIINEIERLLINDVNAEDDYSRLKIFSTKGDRLPTYKAVFNDNPNSSFTQSDIILYDPKNNQIDALLLFGEKYLKSYTFPQIVSIYQSLIKSLRVVWIPLDERKDDVQAIFESLNDGGLPLSASELLCNLIFKPIVAEGKISHEKMHNELWLKTKKVIGEKNFEPYLRDLFSIGEKKRVGSDRRMYVHFKVKNRKLSSSSSVQILERIVEYSTNYNQISNPSIYKHKNSDIQNFLIKINETNMETVYPFLLCILRANDLGTLEDVNAIKLIKETYTLLVRRKMSNLSVTKYDTLFPNLYDKISNEENKIKALQKAIIDEQLWVSDQMFEESFLNKEIYNKRELNFCRLILQEIDRTFHKFDEYPDYTTISTIEHILPQTLNEEWVRYLGSDSSDPSLTILVNTIGNLSLNGQVGNSTFGQKSFCEKIKLYPDSSGLSKDIKTRKEPWNIEAIKSRSRDLAQKALMVWPWSI